MELQGIDYSGPDELEPLLLVSRRARLLAEIRILRPIRCAALHRTTTHRGTRTLLVEKCISSALRKLVDANRATLTRVVDAYEHPVEVARALAACPRLRTLQTDNCAVVASAARVCTQLERLALTVTTMEDDVELPSFRSAGTLQTISLAGTAHVEFVRQFAQLTELDVYLAAHWRANLGELSAALAPLERLSVFRLSMSTAGGFWADAIRGPSALTGTLVLPIVHALILGQGFCDPKSFNGPESHLAAPALHVLASTRSDIGRALRIAAQAPVLETLSLTGDVYDAPLAVHLERLLIDRGSHLLGRLERLLLRQTQVSPRTLELIGLVLQSLVHLEAILTKEHRTLAPFCRLVAPRLTELHLQGAHDTFWTATDSNDDRTVMSALLRLSLVGLSPALVNCLGFPALTALCAERTDLVYRLIARCPRLQSCSLLCDGNAKRSSPAALEFPSPEAKLRFPSVRQLFVELHHMLTSDIGLLLGMFPNVTWLDARRTCFLHCVDPKRLGELAFATCVSMPFYGRLHMGGMNDRCRDHIVRSAARAMPALRELYVSERVSRNRSSRCHIGLAAIRALVSDDCVPLYSDGFAGAAPVLGFQWEFYGDSAAEHARDLGMGPLNRFCQDQDRTVSSFRMQSTDR